ncbi:hypothetical protein C7452_1263 [Methanothermobacter defluvii]|uniref:Cell wall biosynthesis protein n=1 Tax=Methanothermobacter defluvii TaxID=49339 RepID=A0A371NCQ8_9EURY|nr:hypothetical protein [Methanothermobacter defluvii]REE26302.1 hypothetical protein C7452_1263 [Methanothermobacter defluvii]
MDALFILHASQDPGSIMVAAFTVAALTPLMAALISRMRDSNLYTDVRGGTPRGTGLVPWIVLSVFMPEPLRAPVVIMGLLAFIDDLSGRRRIRDLPVEWGQLSRGLGIIAVTILTYPIMGPVALLVALMIQPLNIADMQPGVACSLTVIMSLLAAAIAFAAGSDIHLPLLVLAVCAAYSPLDYLGRIMMGEVGNHTFAVALGLAFYVAGGAWSVLMLFLTAPLVTAILRRGNLTGFLEEKLGIENPTFGDLYMDVMTGGGLGDLLRRILLGRRSFRVDNPVLIALGVRRLLFNPYASHGSENR